MEAKRMEKANAFLTDMLISTFAGMLGGLDAIESEEEPDKELQKDKLLKRDIKSIVSKITPYLPYLGIFSGEITTSKQVLNHWSKQVNDNFAKGPIETKPKDEPKE